MKKLRVKKLTSKENISAINLSAYMNNAGIDFQPIDIINWQEYPYLPDVKFRLAYNDANIFINYRVKEESVRAKYANDNDAVWTDSCAEFFIIPGGDGIYYNIEATCIGTVLVGVGEGRDNREHPGSQIMNKIDRWSSLGREPFEERSDINEWELSLVIPFSTFFKHTVQSLEGKTVKANFYKCGDELKTPHFVSWNRIEVENPDFHRPEFFGEIEFE